MATRDKSEKPQDGGRSTSETIRLVALGVILVVVLLFAIANSDSVRVDYLVDEKRSPLIFVILGSAILGALAGALARRRRDR